MTVVQTDAPEAYALETIAGTLGLAREAVRGLADRLRSQDLRMAADLLRANRDAENVDEPSVERLQADLLSGLRRERSDAHQPLGQLWYYPVPKPFAVFLSHDVDEVRWSWRRRLLMAARHPSTLGSRGSAYWNFERAMTLEAERGIRSTFFVVPSGGHARDPPYRFADLLPILRMLAGNGWEIGVHGSYESFDRRDLLVGQKQVLENALGQRVDGVRQHFINFLAPTTWGLQDQAGFAYDSTLARRERAGFRTGFCHPYRPPGLQILEIPLIVMDGQLFWYEQLDPPKAYARTMALIHTVSRYHGVACLDWHQHTMDELSFPGWWSVFRRTLEAILPMDPWFATGRDIAAWWNRRARIQLEERTGAGGEGTWRIVDPVGGPVTLRILPPEGETLKSIVRGSVDHETIERDGAVWVCFPRVPAGEPVEVSLSRSL